MKVTGNPVLRSHSIVSAISSLSSISDHSHLESEDEEVITIPIGPVSTSRLTHRSRTQTVIVTSKPVSIPVSSYQPYIVTTTTPVYRKGNPKATKTMVIQEIVTPEKPSAKNTFRFIWYVPSQHPIFS